jgi:hypothetical protein
MKTAKQTMNDTGHNPENRIALFQRKEVRRTIHNNEWWFQEIEDLELAAKRTRALYKAKGYSDDWIEKRLRSIAIRDELTGEWQKRGVKEQREYAILTASKRKAAAKLSPAKTTFPSPNPRRQLNPCATPPPPNCQGRAVLRRGLHSRKGAWPPNPRLKKVNVNRNRENEQTQKPCQYRKEREPRNTRNTRTPIFFGGKGLDFSRISRISRFKKFLRRGFGWPCPARQTRLNCRHEIASCG